MALFSVKKEKLHIGQFLPVLLLLFVTALFAFSSDNLTNAADSREQEIVSTALNRSITQCYALEGNYPPDLDYLCDHYGFTYNKDHFFIDYQYIGSNLRPDVTIICIKEGSGN